MRGGFLPMAAAGLAVAGCVPSVADVAMPAAPAAGWHADTRPAATATEPDRFWQAMGDRTLADLIPRAVARNATLEGALARIEQARADARLARSALLPNAGLNAGLSARDLRNYNTAQYSSAPASVGLDLFWNLDLFGGARAGRRAAIDRYRAARLDAAVMTLLIETEVARTYVQIATLDDREAVLRRSIANARGTLRIVGLRIDEGMAMAGDRGVQLVEVNRLEAQLTQLRQARRTTESSLAVLLGEDAPAFAVAPTGLVALQSPILALGQPADLLARRPDIAAAEARIAAASGDVRQARAAFLPNLRISASGLGQMATLGGALGSTLSIGGNLVAPIFAGGSLRARLDSTVAQRGALVADYRRTTLVALKEAVDGIAAEAGARSRHALFAAALDEARASGRIARARYAEGESDLGGLLDAERGVIAAEDGVVLAAQDRLLAAIDLYAALGGSPRLMTDSGVAVR